jgi:AraC-like DNA-binding protein
LPRLKAELRSRSFVSDADNFGLGPATRFSSKDWQVMDVSDQPTDDPLARYRLVTTSDVEEFRHVLMTAYRVEKLTVSASERPRQLNAVGNVAKLNDITVGFATANLAYSVDFPPLDYVRLQIMTQGRSQITNRRGTFATDPMVSGISPSGQPVRQSQRAGNRGLYIRFPEDKLMRMLIAILGAKPKAPLEFAPTLQMNSPAANGLRELVLFLIRQLDVPGCALPTHVIGELEDAIVSAFLHIVQHGNTPLLEKETDEASLSIVRKVEELIEAHWQEKMGIERLFAETGISSRGIYRSFRRHRAYTPSSFAKAVRLRHARAQLDQPSEQTTVTGVAFRCGFASLGHFAREYRQTHGELPSDTLDRSRREQGLL